MDDDSGSESDISNVSEDIKTLEQDLSQTPSYSNYLSLISLLRVRADLSKLRETRESCSRAFPLSANVWTEWIADEIMSESAAMRVGELYNRANTDFYSAQLHIDRLTFAIQLQKGSLLAEERVLQLFQQSFEQGIAFDCNIRDTLYKLYNTFQSTPLTPPSLPEGYQVFEKRLLDAVSDSNAVLNDEETAQIYLSYASFASTHPLLATNIYERSIAHFPSNPSLWTHYISYTSSHRNEHMYALLKRAVRNVPSDLSIWRKVMATVPTVDEYLQAIQDVQPHVTVSHDLSGALMLTRMIWTRSLDFPSRPDEVVLSTLSFNIPQSTQWASACVHAAFVLKKPEGYRLMEEVVNVFPQARFWLAYARLVGKNLADSVYERGLKSVASATEVDILEEAWMCSEVGGVEKLERIGEVVKERRMQGFSGREGWAKEREMAGKEKGSKEKGSKEKGSTEKRERTVRNGRAAKRKRGDEKQVEDEKMDDKKTDDKKTDDKNMDDKKMEDKKEKKDGDKMDATVANGGEKEKTKEGTEEESKGGEVEPRTIFVSNLPFNIKESDLESSFSAAGKIQEIRLPKRNDGASKGIGYIEFEEESAVEAALKMNDRAILGRSMWVRRSKPPARKEKGRGRGSRGRGGRGRGGRGGGARGGGARGGGGRGRGGRSKGMERRKRANIEADVKADTGGDVEMGENEEKKDKKMGQDDFRALLGGE